MKKFLTVLILLLLTRTQDIYRLRWRELGLDPPSLRRIVLLGLPMAGLEGDGEPIPAPTALKDVQLEPNERAVLVDVYMPAVRLAHVNRSVNRTVTLPAWLNAAALERGVNFSQVLQEALRSQLRV